MKYIIYAATCLTVATVLVTRTECAPASNGKIHVGPLPSGRGSAGTPAGPGNSTSYLLVTPNDVINKRYGKRVRLDEKLSGGSSITFNAGTTDFNRLMRITLAEPNVLDDSAQYVVTATIAHRNPVSVTTDMDLYVTVSDGISAVGYLILDETNRKSKDTMWPCEGSNGKTFVDHELGCTKLKSQAPTKFSPPHTVQVKFGGDHKAFGIAKTVSDVTVMSTHDFARTLKPENGIFVDIYRHNKGERYIIDFIEVRLEKEI